MLTNCLSVFGHFVGLALKGLRWIEITHQKLKYSFSWKIKTRFEPIGPKAFDKKLHEPLVQNFTLTFTNMVLIWPESLDESNNFFICQIIPYIRGVGLREYFNYLSLEDFSTIITDFRLLLNESLVIVQHAHV